MSPNRGSRRNFLALQGLGGTAWDGGACDLVRGGRACPCWPARSPGSGSNPEARLGPRRRAPEPSPWPRPERLGHAGLAVPFGTAPGGLAARLRAGQAVRSALAPWPQHRVPARRSLSGSLRRGVRRPGDDPEASGARSAAVRKPPGGTTLDSGDLIGRLGPVPGRFSHGISSLAHDLRTADARRRRSREGRQAGRRGPRAQQALRSRPVCEALRAAWTTTRCPPGEAAPPWRAHVSFRADKLARETRGLRKRRATDEEPGFFGRVGRRAGDRLDSLVARVHPKRVEAGSNQGVRPEDRQAQGADSALGRGREAGRRSE